MLYIPKRGILLKSGYNCRPRSSVTHFEQFSHGTFDLFHAGHSYFLNQSKKEGDILIVGIDSDEKTGKIKGITRPIIPEKQRIEILLNHKAVDFVFLIDKINYNEEKFYLEMYDRFFPNIMTYGRNFE
ncbi:hypothetical protein A3F07_00550 [candidate division WWE3 bacterium RIFCSPHIGHO2_12_FULL_38_15]|uniref:Cytidyltransferase-like domain-containing protein n=1 Tax=candidate division WWE3 bacterium RIFCSPHIGHO2_02_FULL_38_14 TaxID=1802620 RepID=A0A1F4VCJ0_UNCKA|nr:MAG: hypothetical protein A2793_00635 [candidate division WWE3 bacterium RIFCSPHIGHO2_01_FULL_38_45]OGC49064.1 MAG: hypothetical protein A3F07_00550 [candidate division WWE3 bacterium RIFCSPHIGHO2_12_FULL_38_15]OGC53519.1 MAG: hypothetical protein A3B64_04185 [candidate division WWE3 bacterium RIFCSPLOWO2_01_FULL_37_24]OGC54423.1 MAG: hypothetical protein A3D91_00815 [candidate division WWE3 bacterium RIFCSPHIGHO2_02_FULL_38_14]HLB51668.1 adenylyltransferase/cytidyltransferase family protein